MIPRLFLADSHALVWYWMSPLKLPTNILDLFDGTTTGEVRIVVSHVSLAEIYFLFRKWGRDQEFLPRLADLRTHPGFALEPLLLQDIEQLPHFESVPEMHDRLLVIQAMRLGVPLLTKDRSIQASGAVPWIW